MATHDNTIVDRMQQRVVEIEDGVVVRDEATGSYVPKVVDSADRDERIAVRTADDPGDEQEHDAPVPQSPDHRPDEDLPRDEEAERQEAERLAEEDAEPALDAGLDWDDWDEEETR
jgi:cell division transport system ATP-binding protein